MFVGVCGIVIRIVDGLIEQEIPWGWHWSTHNERKNVYGRIVLCRSSTISNWASDRLWSLLIMDISLMRLLDHDKHACWRSMRDVSKVQTERASGSRLNWRHKMDLDTSGFWVLFWGLDTKYWVFGIIFGIWSSFWRLGKISEYWRNLWSTGREISTRVQGCGQA